MAYEDVVTTLDRLLAEEREVEWEAAEGSIERPTRRAGQVQVTLDRLRHVVRQRRVLRASGRPADDARRPAGRHRGGRER